VANPDIMVCIWASMSELTMILCTTVPLPSGVQLELAGVNIGNGSTSHNDLVAYLLNRISSFRKAWNAGPTSAAVWAK
jgi:hypothetical protein